MSARPDQNLPEGRYVTPPAPHRGWHSRGYLPHFDHPDTIQTLTFRLADSLPSHLLDQFAVELRNHPDIEAERRKKIEEWLDKGHGECHLSDPRIAELVEGAFCHFDSERYQLLEWVVMPNHCHAIFEPIRGHKLEGILHSWRSYTAHQANKILSRSGRFWAYDYFDRYVRDETHYRNAIEYVHMNPVKAGFVLTPEAWRFGSARFRI